MKCVNANTLFLQITSTINDIDRIVSLGADQATQSYLARYLTVYICGVYEQSIEEIIWEHATIPGHEEIENFVANQMNKSFRNPDMSNIINLVKQFSTQWANELKNLDTQYTDGINSIVNNKNLLAHGSSSVITLSDIKYFHNDASEVIKKIDKLFLGT
jgi:hypothetical protein